MCMPFPKTGQLVLIFSDIAKIVFKVTNQIKDSYLVSLPSRSANSMDVVFRIVWVVKVDDELNIAYV